MGWKLNTTPHNKDEMAANRQATDRTCSDTSKCSREKIVNMFFEYTFDCSGARI